MKNATLLKMRKNSTIRKISIVWCFSSRTDQFVTTETSILKYIKKTSQNHFFFKKFDFCIFNQKNFEVKVNCSKTPLYVCPLKCTYIGKNSFQFY